MTVTNPGRLGDPVLHTTKHATLAVYLCVSACLSCTETEGTLEINYCKHA